jgi:transposase
MGLAMSEVETTRCDEPAPAVPAAAAPAEERKGRDVVSQVKALLAKGDKDGVVALVVVLQRQLELLGGRRFKTSERLSTSELQLVFEALLESEARSETPKTVELVEADLGLAERSELEEDLEKVEGPAEAREEADDDGGARKAAESSRFPKSLRRIRNVIPVPEEQRPCPKCRCARVCIGHERSELLELVLELVVREDLREKLWCSSCEGQWCRAPLGEKVVARGQLGPNLVACVLVEKYRDGLPLHRQAERFERLGCSLGVSTLMKQVKHAAKLLAPLHEAAVRAVLAAKVMQLDGTSLPVQDCAHPKGKRLGSLWCYVGDARVAVFQYASTGKKLGQKPGERGPEDMLAKRAGLTVADASGLFDASFRRPELVECGCNAHARRNFVEALDGGDSRAARVIAGYKKLYALERKLRRTQADDAEKLAVRQRRSKPIFDAILAWCRAYQQHVPPKTALGGAIQYFVNHHEALGRFLEHPAVPIDNNLVERQQVRVALTRKNFLFVGSDEGGKRAAIVYTLLASCALNEVDPVAYLADVLPKLRGGLLGVDPRDLLPDRWKARRSEAPSVEAPAA